MQRADPAPSRAHGGFGDNSPPGSSRPAQSPGGAAGPEGIGDCWMLVPAQCRWAWHSLGAGAWRFLGAAGLALARCRGPGALLRQRRQSQARIILVTKSAT